MHGGTHFYNPVEIGGLQSSGPPSAPSLRKSSPCATFDLSKTNKIPLEKLGMMEYTCNPRIQEKEAELLQV